MTYMSLLSFLRRQRGVFLARLELMIVVLVPAATLFLLVGWFIDANPKYSSIGVYIIAFGPLVIALVYYIFKYIASRRDGDKINLQSEVREPTVNGNAVVSNVGARKNIILGIVVLFSVSVFVFITLNIIGFNDLNLAQTSDKEKLISSFVLGLIAASVFFEKAWKSRWGR